jgi:hypothetical protein
MITEIRVIPRGKGEPVSLEIIGDLAALMADANSVTTSMVAGVGLKLRPSGYEKDGLDLCCIFQGVDFGSVHT